MNILCTIIALNYLPQAMSLLKSIREIYPEIEFWVLITDTQTRDIPFLPTAKILLPEDLDISPESLQEMRSYYDQVELATSLKPYLLNTLLVEGVSTVTFLDPDILLFSELTEGFDYAERFGIALTPHRLTPSDILDSGYHELAFLQYGIFNLGYICVGRDARSMLDWWEQRLRWFCTRFPSDMVFTDQKWMNFVPALFDFKVIRNFGYDFAPWNLDERILSQHDERYFVNGETLVFIHFSQMSGALASGKQTDLWKDSRASQEGHQESIRIINQLTSVYKDELVRFRKESAEWGSRNRIASNDEIPSFHKRQKLILGSLDRARRSEEPNGSRRVSHPRGSFTRRSKHLMERSSALNGLRSGLKDDLKRIASRYLRAGKS